MKRHIFPALLACILILMPARAQERSPRANSTEARIANRVEVMARQLDLSEEQVAKITQLYKELAESGGDPAALRESISEILTPEQREKLGQRGNRARTRSNNETRERTRSRADGPRRGNAGPPWRPGTMPELTDAQMTRLRHVVRNRLGAARESQAAFRDSINAILAPDQRMAAREMMRTMAMRRGRMAPMQWRMRAPRRGMERGRSMRRGDRIERRNDRADRRRAEPVRLSAEQREAMESARKEIAEARRTFEQENPDATDAEKRDFGMAQRNRHAEAIESILTAEQQLMMMRRSRQTRAESSRLNLSEEQEVKIKEALSAHRQAEAAWADANPDATREARAENARMHREAVQEDLKEILSAEQLEALERGDKRRRTRRSRRMR